MCKNYKYYIIWMRINLSIFKKNIYTQKDEKKILSFICYCSKKLYIYKIFYSIIIINFNNIVICLCFDNYEYFLITLFNIA